MLLFLLEYRIDLRELEALHLGQQLIIELNPEKLHGFLFRIHVVSVRFRGGGIVKNAARFNGAVIDYAVRRDMTRIVYGRENCPRADFSESSARLSSVSKLTMVRLKSGTPESRDCGGYTVPQGIHIHRAVQ